MLLLELNQSPATTYSITSLKGELSSETVPPPAQLSLQARRFQRSQKHWLPRMWWYQAQWHSLWFLCQIWWQKGRADFQNHPFTDISKWTHMSKMHEKLSPNSWKEKLLITHFSFSNHLEILWWDQNYFKNLNYFKLHELKAITPNHITCNPLLQVL